MKQSSRKITIMFFDIATCAHWKQAKSRHHKLLLSVEAKITTIKSKMIVIKRCSRAFQMMHCSYFCSVKWIYTNISSPLSALYCNCFIKEFAQNSEVNGQLLLTVNTTDGARNYWIKSRKDLSPKMLTVMNATNTLYMWNKVILRAFMVIDHKCLR